LCRKSYKKTFTTRRFGEDAVKREEAIALLKEITANYVLLQPKWISLVNGTAGYEVHIKPDDVDLDLLKFVVEKRALSLKEGDGLIIIHG
jgi:hypothetical protein